MKRLAVLLLLTGLFLVPGPAAGALGAALFALHGD